MHYMMNRGNETVCRVCSPGEHLSDRASISSSQPSATPTSSPTLPSPFEPGSLSSVHCDTRHPESQVFTLHHLELLHHAETEMHKCLMLEGGLARSMLTMIISNALSMPYLMDEFLATSALHLSTLHLAQREFYLHEAVQLRKRALTLFDEASTAVSDENGLGKFLFSSLLGLQGFFETFSLRDNFHAFVDRFVNFLRLQQVARSHAHQSWGTIREKALGPVMETIETASEALTHSGGGNECDRLLALLEAANLSPSSVEACLQATNRLQWVFDMHRSLSIPGGGASHIVLAWPMLVPPEFIDMLEQRRAEALLVLVYYAVLLHNCSKFWVFGDAGGWLIQLITEHLGMYWKEWLVWPNEVVRTACNLSAD